MMVWRNNLEQHAILFEKSNVGGRVNAVVSSEWESTVQVETNFEAAEILGSENQS